MARKLQMITNLYQQAVKEVTASPENWMAFLDSACRNYRLPFDEQLLIHVQRPNATAVLEIEKWNKRFGRWVKKGSKGIAVLDKSAEQMQLKFYFDISDTQESRYKSLVRPVPLWEVKEDYQDEVKETLIHSFSIVREDNSFEGIIMETAENVVAENLGDYESDLFDCLEGSLLEGLDEQNIHKKFRDIMESSIMYMLFSRCGYHPKDYLEPEDFADIVEFNTSEVIHILGTSVSDIAELPLGEIADTIVNRMRYEKKKYHTFAYREDDRYSVTITENIQKGGISYERNHIQQVGRLSSAQSDRTGGAGSIWEVRIATPDISDGKPLRKISESADTGQIKSTPATDTADSNKPDGAVSAADGTGAERDRAVEVREPDGVGGKDEQHPPRSRGNRAEGIDLQLAKKNEEKSGVNKLPDFSFDLVEELLCYDEQLTKRRFDIQLYFQEHEDDAERTEYIKSCYQKDIYTLFDVDNQRVGYKAQEDGLWVWEGEFLSRSAQSVFSWAVVQELIADMIQRGVYYNHHPFGKLPTENQQLSLFDMEFGIQMEEPIEEVENRVPESKQEKNTSDGNRQDEIDNLYHLFAIHKIEDIQIKEEVGILIASDGDYEWRGQEIYDFLLGEVIQYEPDGSCSYISKEELDKLQEYRSKYKIIPTWEKPKKNVGIQTFELLPDIPKTERNQYHIINDELGHGTPKEKFRANIMAIQLLKKCEREGRYATTEEQEILANYVGWGGLSEAFDETKSAWETEYLELKTVLNDEEYEAARASTLTAFYTPPVVIRAMYQALENMGLQSGNLLDPSCGIGNFIGMKPKGLADCKIYGVEIDSLSGRIAGQLYQQSTITTQGYETVDLPDSFFDVAIGNVPFGQFKVSDKRYNKNNFLIHDYFFAKTLDKVRPGGVIAFITSSGTMDKKNPSIRKYIAERAELIGAIRLPNDTFQKNAGTKVTSDILFLQKRDHVMAQEPDWLYLDTDENGITMNHYFVEHPEMVLGEMVMETGPFGMESTCKPKEDRGLESQLQEAILNIHAEITDYEVDELVEEDDHSIPATPKVANFSFTLVSGQIYYRENSRMKPVELSVTGENRVKGMIAIRDCVRTLIEYQTEDYSDEVIRLQQEKLNTLYDDFQKKYGLLNSRGNSMAFSEDNSYPLLCSLEVLGEDGTFQRKADMFHKRTIKPRSGVQKVDTASEALIISMGERACVDMGFMQSLTGKSAEDIEEELTGVIFRLPQERDKEHSVFVTEDEYLSGNVREKLKMAKLALETSPIYQSNVDALEKVQPKDLSATEIAVRLGTTWIPVKDIEDFIFELLSAGNYAKYHIKVHYSKVTGEWNIEGKSYDKENVKANSTYGTSRANAYRIIEDSLNLRDTRIYDYEIDEDGKRKAILNKKETAIAQGKQEIIKQVFEEWIWKEPERRERLVRFYNNKFNAIRPREYDGSHLKFDGINPEITLREHQKNGVARIIYGGNTLLAHVVGAGKTFTMVAAAMEMKRLGLCHKSMIVVPNHIIEQFASEWMQLYPAANILVASKKSFEKKNRKKFCARIATGDYDAVIIGHSQFEKIPVSIERQKRILEKQKEEIIEGIREVKQQNGQRFTVKQLEKTKRSLEQKLKKLNNQERKDDVIYFEELGVDRLFVDEADNYKNLFLYTKMRNVSGIAQTEAQKSSDMYMKCRYMDEITGGKGIIFATGTPISNSMVELYTMQRYLQYGLIEELGFLHFDSWAAQYGETINAIELAPEGMGYRMKVRFAKFNNVPELMAGFREVADIQTEDMLQLDVPKANYRVVIVKPSQTQKEMVEELAARAERVRNGMVDATKDNMLLITNDGRKLALDQRLINELLPDEDESKVNACVKEIVTLWKQGKDKKLTQLVFSDLSTPKSDGSFNVYDDLRKKLVDAGIPKEEIVFIHEATTDTKKKELYAKVRNGTVRVLIGSTFKMGAGTNVQDLLVASHDLDCPWRPRDLEQRRGRSIRQGNQNEEVDIIRYVTEGTFDAYLYQVIENKQKFISQIMTSKSPARSVEDVDMTALSYAEIKALASGNPAIKEKMDLDISVSKLQLLKQSFLNQKYELENKIVKYYPKEIKDMEKRISCYEKDMERVKKYTPVLRDTFPVMEIQGKLYEEKADAGKALIEACKSMTSPDEISIGSYRGMQMGLFFNSFSKEYELILRGNQKYQVTLGADIYGNITRIDNAINGLEDKWKNCKEKLSEIRTQYENAKREVEKPFSKEDELREKSERLEELNALLNMGEKNQSLLGIEDDQSEPLSEEREKTGIQER